MEVAIITDTTTKEVVCVVMIDGPYNPTITHKLVANRYNLLDYKVLHTDIRRLVPYKELKLG